MSEARAITNLIGNGVATLVIAKWEGALDERKLQAVLAGDLSGDFADDPEEMLAEGKSITNGSAPSDKA